ncbi:MAG: PKD domain-containing protein [Planctomycetes bacterium]|nr:PKD domain-containing protein [Planctomycetota bacterium]
MASPESVDPRRVVPTTGERQRRRSRRLPCAASAAGAVALLATALPAQTWSAGFTTETIGHGWDRPTCARFANAANLLVGEKAGRVWNVRGGVKRLTPVLDLRSEVLDNGDRGLLTLLPDPDWEENGYIYLGYIVDPNQDDSEDEQESFGRIVRYTTILQTDGELVADPASRKVLIGKAWPGGIPSLHYSHSIGDMRFAADGSLLITSGDGAHYDLVDAGGWDPNGFGPGKFNASEDIGAFRSQSLTSLAGKVLRIDPATGEGLPDNPFFTGSPTDNQSRVWATGLRNPFRFALRPGTGSPEKLWIGDVGWATWEEINSAQSLAENFGWPCFEGQRVEGSYDAVDPISACDDPTVFTKPTWSLHHWLPGSPGFTMQCISGLHVYDGANYPTTYQGRLFFCEYASNFIRTVRFVGGKPTDVELFGNNIGNPVDLVADPANGDLIYVAIGDNAVRRIRYTNSNGPPVIDAAANPYYGPSPLTVTLDASGSSDPEGQPLTFFWEFGDGTTGTNAIEVHTYPLGIDYQVKLTVTDAGGETATWKRKISVDNSPPVITQVVSPPQPSFYVDGQPITFDVIATDVEDNAAGVPLTIEWQLDLVHDHHVHPAWHKLSGTPAYWNAESEGDGTWYQVTCTVIDSRGLRDTLLFDLYDLDNHAHPHLESVSDVSPRLHVPLTAMAHLHYPGKGGADLIFDWGDGTRSAFHPQHLQNRQASHDYSAPGLYTLRVIGHDGDEREAAEQVIQVRPLHPGVAIFVPGAAEKSIGISEQWATANQLADDLRSAGFEAEIFTYTNQNALARWAAAYLNDSIRDYVVVLDIAPAVLYAGEDDGSLAETWLDSGNGVIWTGEAPFTWSIDELGNVSSAGANAADEVLDASGNGLCSGSGTMQLLPPAVDLPALQSYTATRALLFANLGIDWTEHVTYADNGAPGAARASDALVVRHVSGGEFAQFHVKNDDQLPRAEVLRDFLLTQLFAGLPAGPGAFALQLPLHGQQDVSPLSVRFDWGEDGIATSYKFELDDEPTFARPITIAETATSSFTPAGPLRPKTQYWWRVTARNDYGSWVSSPATFTTSAPGKKHR